MKRGTFIFALIWTMLAVGLHARAANVTWLLTDASKDYYANPKDAGPGVARALNDARAWWADRTHAGDRVTLLFGAGTYRFRSPETATKDAAIDVSRIDPGTDAHGGVGRLIIEGAGEGKADLLFEGRVAPGAALQVINQIEINGRDASHISFEGLHLGRVVSAPDGATGSVTQGTVAAVVPDRGSYDVVVDIPPGFPTPADVYDSFRFPVSGRFLRTFVYRDGVPQIRNVGEEQTYWQSYRDVSTPAHPRRFALLIAHARKGHGAQPLDLRPVPRPTYQPGDLVGIKSKHGEDCGRFSDVSDIVFDHIRWTDCTRIGFVQRSDRISITHCVTDRGEKIGGLVPCLASNEGGPQINPTSKGKATNIYFAHNESTGQGDDAVAFFRVDSGLMVDNILSDDWARGINLQDSPDIACRGNVLVRNISLPDVLPAGTASAGAPVWISSGRYWDWNSGPGANKTAP